MCTSKTTQKPEHLFIKNPISGNLVNLMPLFEMMSQDSLNDGPVSLIEKIQMAHDFISTHVPKVKGCEIDVHDWVEVNFWLVEFRKTFERMKEVPI